MKNNTFKPQPGDIFLVRNHHLLGKWVRLLIAIRYGTPFKKTFSHIESGYDDVTNISAEPAGVRMVRNNRFDKKTEYCVYRLKKMDGPKQLQHQDISRRFLGKGYAYSRYLLDFMRIGTFFLLLTGVLLALLGVVFSISACKILALVSAGLLLVLSIVKPILNNMDVLTYDCTELQSMIFTANGLWIPQEKSRNEYPDGMKQVLDNLQLNQCADLVFSNLRSGRS